MIDVTRVVSLTHFRRNTKALLQDLKRHVRPLVVTVHGKAELAVLGTAAFQRLVECVERAEVIDPVRMALATFRKGQNISLADIVDRADAIEGIRRGLAEVEAGRHKSVDEAFHSLRRNLKHSRRR